MTVVPRHGSGRRGASLLAGALLGATSLQAQAGEPARTSLHTAWLAEVFDLDVERAVRSYAAVAADARPGHLERWIAAARLAELQRLRVSGAPAATLADAPASLKTALGTPPPLPDLAAMRQRASAGAGPPPTATTEPAAEPNRGATLRPFVAAAESWLIGQVGPSLRDRQRQRFEALATRPRNQDLVRNYALAIVRAEVEGSRSRADALRSLYFAEWQAPVGSGDPRADVAQARANLRAWSSDAQRSSAERGLWEGLAKALDQLEATEPTAVAGLLRRLPLYSEMLLRPPASSEGGR